MIALHDITFTPAGSPDPILHGISLRIGPGERVGIVGPSGSGKSTLGYHLCGVQRLALAGTTTGKLLLAGKDGLAGGPPGFAGIVGQNPEAQLFCRTVRDEVLLGPRMHGVSETDCQGKASRLIERHGLTAKADAVVASLSLGQKQLTAILSMLALEPKVLLLDEPTSYLDTPTADRLFHHLDELSRSRGWIVMVIEHDRHRLSGFADRFLTLTDGRLICDGSMVPLHLPARRPLPPPQPAPPLVRCEGLGFGYTKSTDVLASIDLTVGPGECVALMGPNGSGKSTLLRLIKGLAKPSRGAVRLREGLSAKRHVGLMLQNPEEQLFAHTVETECGYWPANLGIEPGERRERVRRTLAALGLGGMEERAPFSLSFGEKRRLCLASILVAEPTVLCLDEPTTGLDDANMGTMAAMIAREAEAGKAVIVATHEASFAAMAATRIVRIEEGRIVSDRPTTGGAS